MVVVMTIITRHCFEGYNLISKIELCFEPARSLFYLTKCVPFDPIKAVYDVYGTPSSCHYIEVAFYHY